MRKMVHEVPIRIGLALGRVTHYDAVIDRCRVHWTDVPGQLGSIPQEYDVHEFTSAFARRVREAARGI